VGKIAVIGGSGLYSMPGLEVLEEKEIKTPFGEPSAPIVVSRLGKQEVIFLARHGIGHHLSPSEINYRANIYALKSLGVEMILGISACGSLREDFAPGDIVIPDQLFDFTKDRKRSFFTRGLVAHVNVANPFCNNLVEAVYQAVKLATDAVHKGGSYITIEGPRFSTRAESNTYRAWGMSIIGMTTSPEAFLAREAEMCYAAISHVTDYDVWHVSEKPVTVDMVIEILNRNTTLVQQAVMNLISDLPVVRECECQNAMADAFITDPDVIPEDTRQRLHLLVNKYLD
jgi:5'-methylthioadenosine phosphorylase